ncbi:hypothetical protein C0Q70_02854 [Pomacea canaliculata]|uniref:Uncharacterized protein n=1 Tax=Pomacea canaliculata TaxID=400727 RepID=A0A2T7PR42_POMCA|nr:interferon-induced protein with tetratricopeptide repeats 5-like [Pomacea canaliculata]PVD35885.1 hypothetical protein C0Q70_02854 [Pomacea canaliculata]
MNRGQEEGALTQCTEENEGMHQERDIFRRKLREFPNLFGIINYSTLTQKRQQTLLEKFSVEKEDGDHHCTEAEKTASSNLIAFLLFLRKDREKAVEEINNVLQSPNNDSNIVALASMAVIKWEMGDRQEGERFVEKLENLRQQENFQEKVVDAKAEIGYCCSRMGMVYAQLAVDMFKEVVKARPCDYTWKLGLAVALRRSLKTNYVMYFRIPPQLTSERSLRAFDLLLEIKNSNAPDTLRAEALVELGTLLQNEKFPEFEDVKVKARKHGITAEQCYEEAVELAPTDPHVLTHSGKFFSNRKQLQRSRELLERAIEIRPTTTAHHFLGTTLTKLVREEKYQSRQDWGASAGGRRYDNERQIDHKHVKAAIEHFEKAIEISQDDNTPAIYDLGVLYVCVGDDDQALKQFSKLINLTASRCSPIQLIKSHEQVGLIYMRKKTGARNQAERQEYTAEGCRLLQEALQMQCQAVRSLPPSEPDLPASRPSFYDLCCAAKGTKSPNHQLKQISRLYEMIRNYRDYLNVLTEISKFTRQKTLNVENLEECLKNYVTRQQYDHALLFLSLLETTEEEVLISQWSDPELPNRVRVMAA